MIPGVFMCHYSRFQNCTLSITGKKPGIFRSKWRPLLGTPATPLKKKKKKYTNLWINYIWGCWGWFKIRYDVLSYNLSYRSRGSCNETYRSLWNLPGVAAVLQPWSLLNWEVMARAINHTARFYNNMHHHKGTIRWARVKPQHLHTRLR